MNNDQLYENRERYVHLNSIGTTVVSSRPVRLLTFILNTNAGSSIVALHDGVTTGDPLIASLNVASIATVGSMFFGLTTKKGLTVDITGGTPDITIIYQ